MAGRCENFPELPKISRQLVVGYPVRIARSFLTKNFHYPPHTITNIITAPSLRLKKKRIQPEEELPQRTLEEQLEQLQGLN